jgi:hypothetical protein
VEVIIMEEESVPFIQIVEQEKGDRVRLSVPMVGFPPGFRLAEGTRVVLVHGKSGPAVMPLVREVKVDSLSEAAGGLLSVAGARLETQTSTVRGDREHPGPYIVAIVDRGSSQGSEQVIAIQPAPREVDKR